MSEVTQRNCDCEHPLDPDAHGYCFRCGGRAETETQQRAFQKLGESVATLRDELLKTALGRGIIRLLDRLEALLSKWWG